MGLYDVAVSVYEFLTTGIYDFLVETVSFII